MARQIRGRSFARRRPSETNWARIVETTQTTVPASSKVLLAIFVLSNPAINETVLRTRGRLWVQSDQAAAVENQLGAFGMIVVTDLALSIGVASIPGPVTDLSDDGWFVWVPFMQSSSLAADGGPTGYSYEIESKAMRKTSEGFGIALVVENSSASNGFQASIALSLLGKRT